MKICILLFVVTCFSCNQSNVSKGNTKKDTVTSSNAITSKIDSNSENIESNCDELIKQVEDKVTGAKYITNGTDLMISKDGKNGFSILAMITKNTKLLIITAVGAGSCIDDDEKANLQAEEIPNPRPKCQNEHWNAVLHTIENQPADSITDPQKNPLRDWDSTDAPTIKIGH